ncbi:MAG: DUF3226 domain-containing protein [Saprospiraceae bacterium]
MVTAHIWVEGKADQKFLADVMKVWFDLTFNTKDFSCREENRRVDLRIQDLGGKNTFQTARISAAFRQNNDQGVQNIVILDADDIATQRQMLDLIKQELGIEFPYFLLPDNQSNGELENLLEQIIHPQNRVILDCWEGYENCVGQHDNPVRPGHKYTIPAKKSKIYSYLEVLLGETDSEKELAKDPKRDFTNPNHWILDGDNSPLKPLKDFLENQFNFTK